MALTRLSKDKFIPPDVRVLILPLVYIVLLLVFFVVALKMGIGNVSTQRKNIQASKKVENTLTEKLTILKDSQAKVSSFVNPSVMVLPEKNPSLVLISQIKNLAESKSVELSEFNLGGASSREAKRMAVNISLTISGGFAEVVNFFQATREVAPILTLERVELSGSEEVISAEANAKSYWAEFPEKLPPITDPVSKLSGEDLVILQNISYLTPPAFSELTPKGPYNRENPFD